MSLNKQAQQKLLLLLKIPQDVIDNLLAGDEEQDVTIPDGIKVFDAESYTALEASLKATGKAGYINAGKEIAIKDLKEKLGVEYDGKDPEVFLQKATEKILADAGNSDAAKQLTALEQQLADNQSQLEAAINEKNSLARDTEWLMKFPRERSANMSDEDRLLLLRNKLTTVEEDGKTTYLYKGKPLPDAEEDYTTERVMEHVFAAEQWLGDSYSPQRPGRGDHSHRNTNTHKPMTLKEAETLWEQSGRRAEGAEFQAHILSLKKENVDFDLNG